MTLDSVANAETLHRFNNLLAMLHDYCKNFIFPDGSYIKDNTAGSCLEKEEEEARVAAEAPAAAER